MIPLTRTNTAGPRLIKHHSQHHTHSVTPKLSVGLYCPHNRIPVFLTWHIRPSTIWLKLPFKIIFLYFLLHTPCLNQNEPLIFLSLPSTQHTNLWVFCSILWNLPFSGDACPHLSVGLKHVYLFSYLTRSLDLGNPHCSTSSVTLAPSKFLLF